MRFVFTETAYGFRITLLIFRFGRRPGYENLHRDLWEPEGLQWDQMRLPSHVCRFRCDILFARLCSLPGCVRTENTSTEQRIWIRFAHYLNRYYALKVRVVKAFKRWRNRLRCCVRETDCPIVVRNRKNWRTSSKALQNCAADAKLPKPRMG
jgi:hypothetical protein